MLIIFLLLILLYINTKLLFELVCSCIYSRRIRRSLERISCRDDLLYLAEVDFFHVIALMLKRKGNKVEFTDRCGEAARCLIVNDVLLVEMWKHSPGYLVEIESAMKMAKCMQTAGLHRGILISLGDFKTNTKGYCHTNVIECVAGDRLLAMCREVQKCTASARIKHHTAD